MREGDPHKAGQAEAEAGSGRCDGVRHGGQRAEGGGRSRGGERWAARAGAAGATRVRARPRARARRGDGRASGGGALEVEVEVEVGWRPGGESVLQAL